ncbi:hypothetical protein MJO29_013924, partial [Puccinia striiformis f. sp. tritici]
MLKNWCWAKDQLSQISQHYIRQGDHLPSSLINKIINSRDINSAVFNLRQIFFGLYDVYVHTNDIEKEGTDLSKLWRQMRDQISLLDSSPDQQTIVPGQSSFGHVVGYTFSLLLFAFNLLMLFFVVMMNAYTTRLDST